LDTAFFALKDACQVGNDIRDISKEINDPSHERARFVSIILRRCVEEVQQHILLLKYHQNTIELLATQIPVNTFQGIPTKSLYTSLENLCSSFKTFVSEYFHFI
jgi:hypothetical protein